MAGSLVPRTNLGGYLAEIGQVYAEERDRREAAALLGGQLDALVGGAAPGSTAAPAAPVQSPLPSFARAQGAAPSANLAGLFTSASEKYGIDPSYLPRLAMIESGGDPNARNKSGASGLLQFMPKTAQAYGLGNPFDPVASTEAGARLTVDNKRSLTAALGREPTNGELYLGHQQGAGGAAKLLANPNARAVDVVGRQAVLQNGGTEDMTAGQFARKWTAKFDGQADMPAPGARAVGFQIPQAQSDQPGSVVSPAVASGAQGLSGAAPTQAPPRITPQQAQQLRAMLQNPNTAPQAQAIIQRLTAPQEYGFQVVDGQLVRTSKSGTAEPIGLPKAPNLQFQKLDSGQNVSFNPATGETRLIAPGADSTVRNLLTPEERAAAGVPASYRGPAQLDRDGKLLFPGSGQMGITPQEKTDAAGSTVLTDRFKAIGEQGAQGQADLPLLGELRALGDQINTGALAAVQARLGEYGIKTEGSGKVEAYNALLDRLTPQQRIPGAGATSDFDARMFKGSLPRLINTPEGNKLIIDTLEAVAKDRMARGEIADAALLGPSQEGGITQQEALKRLKALPSVQTGFASGMRQLQQAGKLGKPDPEADKRRDTPSNGLSVGGSTVIDGVTIRRVR